MLLRHALTGAAACILGVLSSGDLSAQSAQAAPDGSPAACAADSTQIADLARRTEAARALLRADGGRLWGVRLDTSAWLGVARAGAALCAFATSDPGVAGYRQPGRGEPVWGGVLAPGLTPANTSVDWAGRRWAMVLLPLPSDSLDAVRLLVHEAMHTLQDTAARAALPRPSYQEGTAGAALLDAPAGRIWLRLELRALARALRATGAARRHAARDALAFRRRRDGLATAHERQRERALDVIEGMPEYTAWKLTGGTRAPRLVAATLVRRDSSMADSASAESVVRSFPYATGPAYGLLLDALMPGWRARLRAAQGGADLQALLASAVGTGARDAADAAAERYGRAAIAREERTRWARRERELADLRARFVEGPTIRIRPAALRISFDPRAQASLDSAGTVMRGLVWRGADGELLTAPAGALVTSDWHELRVPAAVMAGGPPTAGRLAAPVHWSGSGWSLTLPAGWMVTPVGTSWVLTPR